MSVAAKLVRAEWSPAAPRVLSVDAGNAGGSEVLSGDKCGGRANYFVATEEMIILQQYSASGISYQMPISTPLELLYIAMSGGGRR